MSKKATFKCKACGAIHIITETDEGYEMELKVEEKPINKEGEKDGADKQPKKRESFIEFCQRLNREG